MILKIFGCAMVVCTSALIGQVLARDCRLRPQQLRELQTMLQMLEHEIGFLANRLADAFETISGGRKGGPAILFRCMAENLRQPGMDAASAWERAVSANLQYTALTREDGIILGNFGRMLGGSDREGQIGNIRLTLSQLRIQEQKAEEKRSKNERMYKSLGLLCGAALAIIFL